MDIFEPGLAIYPIPRAVEARSDHPVPLKGVNRKETVGAQQTNKFYQNLQLDQQDNPAYVVPYTVSWTKGRAPTHGWGLTVSYVTAEQRVMGPNDGPCKHPTAPANYYYNPPLLQHLVLDAAELDARTVLTTEHAEAMSVQVSLRPGDVEQQPAVQFPLVQGQGFVTALYPGNSRPVVRSAAAFQGIVVSDLASPQGGGLGVRRLELQMSDGTAWLLYARSAPRTPALELYRTENNASILYSRVPFCGSVQVARVTSALDRSVYDRAAGVYATGVELYGHVFIERHTSIYGFDFKKADMGQDPRFMALRPLVHFALPHHVASFVDETRAKMPANGPVLQTTVKGVARAVLADMWHMQEPALAFDLGFLPWSARLWKSAPGRLTRPGYEGSVLSHDLFATMVAAARKELGEDMDAQSNLDSMYFAGKALAKFAVVLLAAHDLLGVDVVGADAVADGLRRLKAAFARFAENRQKYPLVYDMVWGGVVSSGAYQTGDLMTDFGGTCYNDHHFHYGYFVYAGAVLAHLDPSWLKDPTGPAFVDVLVRDYATPGPAERRLRAGAKEVRGDDGPPPPFPDSRSFDWYHGHSWAHGVFPSVDGKTQESSSEDTMSLYALRVWGLVRNDSTMAARASVQLAVQARALQTYYYYGEGASGRLLEHTQPAAFAGNKVAGILYENKMDHTTFFGNNPEFIHGIHMLPLLPCTPLARPPAFVLDEWQDLFSHGRADQVPGGWRGVLYGNLATADPVSALRFFGQPNFDEGLLDQGASRTWYLCYAAALLETERLR